MYCKYCGQQIDDKAQFCPYCGKQLRVANDGGKKQGNGKQKKGKKTPRRVWPWLVCLVLFVIATIALLFALRNRNMDNTHVSVRTDDSLYKPDDNSIKEDHESGLFYVNNVILIFFEQGTTKDQIDEVITSVDGEIVGSLDVVDQYQVKVGEHTFGELEEICESIKKSNYVHDAILDLAFPIQNDTIPNDSWNSSFLHKEKWSQDAPEGRNWWLEAINAPDAWDNESYFSHIKIGVIDDGFDTGHEDLKNVIKSVSLNNTKEEHGTHVAGIIGAEADNNKGIAGIVWDCELLTSDWKLDWVQGAVNDIWGLNWNTTNQILGSVVVLVEQGAKVVNISAGNSGSIPKNEVSYSENIVNYFGRQASMYLCSLLTRGYDFVIVQSSGNGNKNHTISVDSKYNGIFCSINEANCDIWGDISVDDILGRVIVVGSAKNDKNNHYTQAESSNAGDGVDICAPGVDVYSTIPGGLRGSYKYNSGTSMAAPVVTGVAALTWSVNPKLRGTQVKEIVCARKNTKYDVADNTSKNHPLTNTYRLVNADLSVKAAIKSLTEKGDEEDVWRVIEESDNKDSNTPVSLDSMHDPIYVFTINNHFANQNNNDLLSNSYSFWSTIALYATIKAYNETDNGEDRIAEKYTSDETGEVVVLSDQAVIDVINAMFPSISSFPDLPESQYETFLHRDGNYYLPLIDLDTESCRIKKIVPKDSGAEAIAELFTYTDDHAYAVYRLTLDKNDKVNTKSPEPYYYCIKNAELIDEPVKEYEELIEEYGIALGDYSLLQNDPDGFNDRYPLINTDVIRRMHDYPDLYLFTVYKDINNDGVTELLISLGNYDYKNVSGIYTRYSKKVIPLLADIDELSTTTVYEDGTIWSYKQGLYGLETIYRISKDGRSLDVIAQYETDWENYPDYPYSDGENRISLQQFQEKYLSNKEEQYFRWNMQMKSEAELPAASAYYNSAYGIVGEWISESGTEKYKFTNSPRTGALSNASGYVEYWDLERSGRSYGDYRLEGDSITIWFTNKGASYTYSYNLHSESGVLELDGTSFNYIAETDSILNQLYGTWISGNDTLTIYGANGAPHQYALDRYSNSDLNGNYFVWDSTHLAINNDIMNYEQMWLIEFQINGNKLKFGDDEYYRQ